MSEHEEIVAVTSDVDHQKIEVADGKLKLIYNLM